MNRRYLQLGIIALALVIIAYTSLDQNADQQPADSGQPFDFYVLALSWSPAFCASEAGQRSAQQCGQGADFGFITHGLWPQFEQGWPSFCQSPHGNSMPQSVAQYLLDIMPDRGLIEHQWDKHGTCAGVDQGRYAQLIETASQSITVPALFEGQPPARLDAGDIERAFQQANPAIPADGIAVTCPGGRFTEVRICLDAALSPRACAEVNRNGCQQENLSVSQR